MKHAHRPITILATVDEVRLLDGDVLIARHRRSWKREQDLFDPVHYLALLEKKPGGFDHARPLEEWGLPDCFSTLRRILEAEGAGTRAFIKVLLLLESYPLESLREAVEYALDIGVHDADSIRVIVEHRREGPTALFSLEGRPHLRLVEVGRTEAAAYQVLLTEEPL